MSVKQRAAFLAIGLILYLLFSGLAGAQEEELKRFVTIDFEEVDIVVFIKYISELTGKNFVIDKTVQGKVTIMSPGKISEEEAYKVFESVLEVHGFATVEAGSIIKIVPAVEARTKNVDTLLKEDRSNPEDKVVTQLIPLKFADPGELKKILSPMISKNSVMIDYQPTRTLIVTDVLSNIKRLMEIISEVDVSFGTEEIQVVQLAHASAVSVAKSINTVFQNSGKVQPAGTPLSAIEVKIVPDERSNLLIILADKAEMGKIKELVDELDQELPRGKGNIQVYYLQHANSEDLAKVLTSLPSNVVDPKEKGKAPVLSKSVQIVADKSTNSLVITAEKADYLMIEDVIKKLDIPRRMVYIEALIMEVNVDKDFRLGVEWLGMQDIGYDHKGAGLLGGFSGSDPSYSLLNGVQNMSLPDGFSMGVFAEAITIGDGDSKIVFPSLGAMLQAYKSDSDVHIISNPQILTTDNEEAQIQVGENVPYLTKEATGDQTYQTYEYRDVGVTLKITPQINQEGVVRLKIFQEVIKLKGTSADFRPSTLKRLAETTVVVKDQSTVVIGGIIGEDTNQTVRKIPLLGDIPLLGYLFRSQASNQAKTNLFVFLTPHIIRNPHEAGAIYEDKRRQVKRMRKEIMEKLHLDEGDQPEVSRQFDEEVVVPVPPAVQGASPDGMQ